MDDQVGQVLLSIYDAAVRNTPSKAKSGLAKATLKFINEFEREFEAAGFILNDSASDR